MEEIHTSDTWTASGLAKCPEVTRALHRFPGGLVHEMEWRPDRFLPTNFLHLRV